MVLRQRIPLPFACKHNASNNESNRIFFGVEFKEYDDGEVHLHVELLRDINDAYQSDPKETNYIPASRSGEVYNHHTSPYQHSVHDDNMSEAGGTIHDEDEEFPPRSPQESFTSPRAPSVTVKNNVSSVNVLPFSTGLRSALKSTALGMLQIHTRRRVFPRRLNGHYLGGATREDCYVKPAKRSAATQD